jgi:hypothetical protein
VDTRLALSVCARSSRPPPTQGDHLIPFPTFPPPRYLFWLFRRPNDFAIVRRFVPKRAVVAFPALSADEIRACALCSAHESKTGKGTDSSFEALAFPCMRASASAVL